MVALVVAVAGVDDCFVICHSVNSANDFVTFFKDMLGDRCTMHVLNGLYFTFKIVPNTVQNSFLVQLHALYLALVIPLG